MAVLLKGGTLFLHVPKTGGEWVKQVLREQNLVRMHFPGSHPDMERVLNFPRYFTRLYVKQSLREKNMHLHRDVLDSYKFCFVRSPFSWYESYWRYMCGHEWERFDRPADGKRATLRGPWFPNAHLQRCASYDFNEFMSDVIGHYPGYLTQMYGWYAPPGEIDFIGKTEHLVDDLVRVIKQVGLDFDEDRIRDTSRVNKSPNAVEPPVWDEQLKREVHRLEYPVFKQYGYPHPPESLRPDISPLSPSSDDH